MSSFKEAFDFTMQHEDAQLSGVVTTDPGGRTRFGIAQKFHAGLPDSFFDGPPEDALAIAEQIAERDYWDAMRLSEIANQNIANKLFDMGVNMGVHQAGHFAQRAVHGLNGRMAPASGGPQPPPAALIEDGKIGDHTLAAINSLDPLQLHQALCELSRQFYRHIAANNPAQTVNLQGWLKRAAA